MLRFSYGLRRHVGQNTCTEILSWSERFVSICETSWIILQIEKGSVFQPAFWFASGTGNIGIASSAAAIYDNKCRPILFGELHWVTPILFFCFGVSELKTKPSPCSDTNIYPSPLFGVIQRHCISCLSFTIPFANKVIKTHRCLETSK